MIAQQAGPAGKKTATAPPKPRTSPPLPTAPLTWADEVFGTDTAGAAADRLPRTTPGGYPLAHKLAARVQAVRAEQEACLVSEPSR